MLLHGYPETWWEWCHVIGPLVRAGYRVIAPDYRGAGGSAKAVFEETTLLPPRCTRAFLTKAASPNFDIGYYLWAVRKERFASDATDWSERLAFR